MRGILWTLLVILIAGWIAGMFFGVGSDSVRTLLAIAIIILCYRLITIRTSPRR